MIAILLYCEENPQWETRSMHSYFYNQLGNCIHNHQQQSLAFKSLNNINIIKQVFYRSICTSRRPLCHTKRSWSTGALALIWHIKSHMSRPQHDFGPGISTLLLLHVKAGGWGLKMKIRRRSQRSCFTGSELIVFTVFTAMLFFFKYACKDGEKSDIRAIIGSISKRCFN